MNESIEPTLFAELAENKTNLLQTYVSYRHARQQDLEGESMLLEQDQAAYSDALTRSLEGVPSEVYDSVMQKEHQERWDAITPPDLKGQSIKRLMGKVALGAMGAIPATLFVLDRYSDSNPLSILFPTVAVASVMYAATKQQHSAMVDLQMKHKQTMIGLSSDIGLDNQLFVERDALESAQKIYEQHQKIRRKITKQLLIAGTVLQYLAHAIVQKI